MTTPIPAGWKPISSAPKDFSTEFDGWNGERVPNVIWAHPEYEAKGEYAWCRSVYVHGHGWEMQRVQGLTHWMPLPAAPGSTSSAPGDAQDEQRAQDGKRPDLDWIEGVRVTDTVGRGWCVRIDGTDIFEDVNRYGCKGRRSFQIAAGLTSKQEAERAAEEWLTSQLVGLAAPAAGDARDSTLLDALETLRKAFVIAVGAKSPFAKQALAKADAAIAAQQGKGGE